MNRKVRVGLILGLLILGASAGFAETLGETGNRDGGVSGILLAGVGGPVADVPNVVGKSLTDAFAILTGAKFTLQVKAADRDGKARVVESQDPPGGRRISQYAVVTLTTQLVQNDGKGRVTLPSGKSGTDDKGKVNLPGK
jgi:hypothetical protein